LVRRFKRDTLIKFTFDSMLGILLLMASPTVGAEPMMTLGAVEDVILSRWKVKIPARIDTGAATSSLDVCELKRLSRKEVEFKLPDRCGGHKIRMPVIAWRTVKSTEGSTERRPVVEMELCLGPKRLRTEVTLNDRSLMEFPLLIGRKTLEGNFVVDVSRSKTLPPTCPEDPSP
jgi:hypothetical protein